MIGQLRSHAKFAAALAVFITLPISAALPQEPKLDVPYVSTDMAVVREMLRLAGVSKDDFLIDLGSGDGRIPIAAAKAFGTRGIGVDLDPKRVAEARRAAQVARVTDKVEFKQEDVFDTDISRATVITMYLLPDVNFRLRPRIYLEPKPGTRVVSHEFDMGNWKPERTARVKNSNLYLWIVPAQVEGTWQLVDPALADKGPVSINFEQRFQHIAGIAKIRGRPLPVRRANLEADRITFELPVAEGQMRRYEGRVFGDRLVGDAWSASRAEQ
jgi:hypothetical protein